MGALREGDGESRLRADARRNQGRLLEAARDVFVEHGTGAPLDEVARRAGVGIGTLYRRFPDRGALLHAVVVQALELTCHAARTALDGGDDGLAALLHYAHAALDARVSAVIPLALDTSTMADERVIGLRETSASLLQQLVDRAHADRTLSEVVTVADIGTLLVRLARPLPGRLPTDVNDALAHRHLDLFVEGVRAAPGRHPPAGPRLERKDLHALRHLA
jgi:AcrR family transcriptional regulator